MKHKIEESIGWYRRGDFSAMGKDAKENILSLYKNDDEKPPRQTKVQISAHLLLIGKAFDDTRLLRMAVEVLMVEEKANAIDILLRTQEILKESKFNKPPH